MSELRVMPEGRTLEVGGVETLLEGLRAGGVPIAHACGGRARCSTCRVHVSAGLENCTHRTPEETLIAEKLGMDENTRLACQVRVRGPVTVRRLVLDSVDASLASSAVTNGGAVGRERELVILFSDVADFTPFSDALPAYDVVHTLDRWFNLAGEVVQRHGGRIDNYMGDGFLAVFDDCEVAVEAGLALVNAAAVLSNYTLAAFGLPFRSRVGIHTGTVVVGTLGAAHNRRTTVIGDVVNVAARIEAANKELNTALLVSESVETNLGLRFRRGRSADLTLKGKQGTHRVIEITSA